ncbi:S24 family peptidase [Lactococcus lactis subsp. lactis]|jgi:phage repressor protein C with HTH and peptisase S24 domain/DNA-binding XRE family transcriptional regulator|uniref:XRE family transcriptional regulator n=1 Tax=Lactococcus lactis TaxID=1358 RepID=UPI0007AE6AF4|nr:S24 family peptidase [Lactococcus lactis]ARD93443.1 transcriptional regulator [Lactococcus lactis subsp. lactis]KZK13573.1 LexA repressor [Lactococcus lactis subsp. lactis bv. diacetylactis]MCT3103445.1 helix-turn-helix domain-containing protein [Lactococcus lactis]MRL66431.1 helix-turn-helix domain-containing protein [Lactococcus lactis subsp. lactis]QTP12356.1 S24 family peptidase [Lactococcus lactis subsp. lactis]
MENILKEKRLEKKLTLEQVGEIVGVGKSTVRKWENGMIENMGRDKIVSLSKALGISPLDILGIGDSENKTDPIKKELNDIFDLLNSKRQKKVLNFASNQLDEQKNNVLDINKTTEKNKLIPIETVEKVSAGFGFHYGENEKTTYYTSRNNLPRFDFATVVDGDSMEPTLHDGDVILIRQNYDTPQGGIYVVDYDGTSWVKEVSIVENELVLHSINEKYRDRFLPVPPEDGEYWNIVGEVVDWFTPENI